MKTQLILVFLTFLSLSTCLLPPKFQWKTLDFGLDNDTKASVLYSGDYIPENNMPSGLARWKDKLFVTIPRWKKGVPFSLNYINLDLPDSCVLNPYPNFTQAFVAHNALGISSNATVVSAFRADVDTCDRLWVADNGVADMATGVRQVADPAIVIFDLNTDKVFHRYILPDEVLRPSSVLTSIVVDVIPGKPNQGCECEEAEAFAYITDMGSNAIIVYSLTNDESWRIDHPWFNFDPSAGIYHVGGVDFFWNDGISSATLSSPGKDGHRVLYFQPTSSTKQFRMSTKLLRDRTVPAENIFDGVEIVGDRGPNTQATACAFDPGSKVLFYTQLSKNGLGCWNTDKPYSCDNAVLIASDCQMMEFPSDVKVDHEGQVWILTNRQSRFLYQTMDFSEVNYRILTAPAKKLVAATNCEAKKGFLKRCKSNHF